MKAEQELKVIGDLLRDYAQHDEAREYTQPLPWREFHDEVGKLWADSQDRASSAAK
jgi:hypothetical protein